MDLTTLWIGDEVKVISSNRTGVFEGIEAGQARVRFDSGYILYPAHEIVLHVPEPADEDLLSVLEISPPKKKLATPFSNVLDLHLEKLPNYSPASGISILEYQIGQCKLFVEEVISRKLMSATIIHGKGAGILRENIVALLAGYRQIKVQHPKNDGGAVELLLLY
jgi:dsDNA-specific endonuclease/ATPase MutS2